MNTGMLKKWLKDVPDNYEVDFSKCFLVVGDDDEERYECILDSPVVGLARSNPDKKRPGRGHIRFLMQTDDLSKRTQGFFRKNLGRIKKVRRK